MKSRVSGALRLPAAVVCGALWLMPNAGRAQTSTGAATPTGNPPRTSWGRPDLSGVWTMQDDSSTPLERPREFGTRAYLTDEEFAQKEGREKASAEDNKADRAAVRGTNYKGNEEGPTYWYERGVSRRTSLIVDPPDGRLPPMTPEAQQQFAALVATMRTHSEADTWQDRTSNERCINRALPRIPASYNNGIRIIETAEFVVLAYEWMHDTRIIPLDGGPHLGKNIHQWTGDPRGHWEGNTLVVDSTNFSDKQEYAASPAGMIGQGTPQGHWHLIERLTPVGPNAIEYRATVEDLTTWTKPWTMMLTWRKDPTYKIFEYACHEGNYGMSNILSGARAEERAARAAATKTGE